MAFTSIEDYVIKSGILGEEEINRLKVEFNLVKEEKSFVEFLIEHGVLNEEHMMTIKSLKLIGPEKIKIKMIKVDKEQKQDQKPLPVITESLVDTQAIFLELFDRYDILEVIGRGAMSWVYKVRDLESKEIRAMKILKYAEISDMQQLKRFERESELLTSLEHPNIVRIYEFGNALGIPYYIMDHIEGTTLEEYISRKSIGIESSLIIIEKIARAIHAAHIKGIIHRDLKPSNVMIDLENEPHIVDFGIAKIVGVDNSTLTKVGEVIGTPAYMSPEQALGRFLDHRGDIFSLGTILYECLTSHNPFMGDTVLVTLSNIMTKSPENPRNLKPEINPALASAVLKCIEKEPDKRFQTAEDLANELENCRTGKISWFKSIGLAITARFKRLRLRKRHFRMIAPVLIIIAVLLSGVAGRGVAINLLQAKAKKNLDEKRYPMAVSQYDLLLLLAPGNTRFLFERGVSKRKMKKYEEALEDFSKIPESNKKDYCRALFNKGYVYFLMGKYDRALQALQGSLSGDVQKDAVYLLMAQSYKGMGNREQALKMAEKAISANPGNREAKGFFDQVRKSSDHN